MKWWKKCPRCSGRLLMDGREYSCYNRRCDDFNTWSKAELKGIHTKPVREPW